MDFFKRRKSRTDVEQFLLRLANERQAIPNTRTREERNNNRSATNLNVGVWVVPVSDDVPDVDAAFTAVTSDIGGNGLGILADCPSTTEEIIVAFSTESQPTFLRTTVRACTALGAGFYRLGTEATALVSLEEEPELAQISSVAAL